MKPKQQTDTSKTITVQRIERKLVEVHVVGMSPVILNRMAEKAKHELLMPKFKNRAQKSSTLKHNPREEFVGSAHRLDDGATYLGIPATAFKCAMADAALDVPGDAKKAPLGRLTYVVGDYVGLFGLPFLYMAIVRMADFNKTPDVRTRVIIPRWAAKFTVNYASPMVTDKTVANLLHAAGMIRGIGDGRVEKGKLSFGQWRLCNSTDKEFKEIVKEGARNAQIKAMQAATPYDEETKELLQWFDGELANRSKPNGQGALSEIEVEESPAMEAGVQ